MYEEAKSEAQDKFVRVWVMISFINEGSRRSKSAVGGHDGGLFSYSGETFLPSGLSNLNFVSITSYVFVFSCYDDICHQ